MIIGEFFFTNLGFGLNQIRVYLQMFQTQKSQKEKKKRKKGKGEEGRGRPFGL
jgi:translation elongation factor EF-1beta